MPSSKSPFPYLALLAGILFLSLSALFVRWSTAPGTVTSLYRMALAALALTPVYVIRRWRGRPRDAAAAAGAGWLFIPKAALGLGILGGVLSALDHGTWSTSIGMTRVANATLLNNTAPIWVGLVAWFIFRERLRKTFWLGLALTMTGATIVLGSDMLVHPLLSWGDLVALLSGLFYAAYFLVTQRARRMLDTLSYMWLADLAAAFTLLLINLAMRQPLSGFPAQTYLAFLGAALISQVAGHISLSYALGHLPASVVSPTMIAQPVLTALLAIPLVGEGLQPGQWIGGLAVLAGIWIVNRSQARAAN
jgi:drug/metabolite transporter (DMT)-like permease